MRIVSRGETANQTAKQSEQQANAARNERRIGNLFLYACSVSLAFGHRFERHETEQRNGDFCHHQYRRYRTKLVVHREIVVKQLGKRHKVISPREHHRECRSCQQSPFVRTFHHIKRQYEKKAYHSTHIYRTGRKRLIAPVHRRRLAERACRIARNTLFRQCLIKV